MTKSDFISKFQYLSESNYGYIYCVLSAILSCILGILIPTVWVLPFVNTLLIYPLFASSVANGKLRQAFLQMMVWTIFMSLTLISLTILFPQHTGEHIFRGFSYKAEMFTWVKTGVGAESNPRQFIPIHAGHFSLFVILSLISGGFIGLFFGSVLLNYMNFYVGNLIKESGFAWQAILMGWQVWAIVRVVGYITVAIALSHLFYVYVRKKEFNRVMTYRYLAGGISLVLLDILLKVTLAHGWQQILQPILP